MINIDMNILRLRAYFYPENVTASAMAELSMGTIKEI